jgi:ribonuclease BN (tRNA processing enzyme)
MVPATQSRWRAALLIGVLACGTSTASAAEAPAVRLITLGTQGGPVSATRAQPANLVTVNGVHYLIDAGNGVARQLQLAGVSVGQIGKIFITHHHDDHNADLGTLIGLAWSGGRAEPIDVYGPPGTESMRAGFLQYFAPNVADRTFKDSKRAQPAAVFRAHEIGQQGLVYEDANIRLSARENCHFRFEPGEPGHGWQTSYAFRIEAAGKSIVFSGDTGACIDQLADFARGATVLVHEVVARGSRPPAAVAAMTRVPVGHTSPEEVGEFAAKANVGQVVLTHLLPGGDALPDAAYSDGVKVRYGGPVTVARDLQEFTLK